MKVLVGFLLITTCLGAFAESPCDVRPGKTSGMKVVEFVSGNTVHSKMSMRETTADALLEEMINLQDMGICEEKITSQKCILKLENIQKKNYISLFRGSSKWNTWNLESKNNAQVFVKNLKRVGFCS